MEVHLFGLEVTTPGKLPGIVLAQHIPVGHTGVHDESRDDWTVADMTAAFNLLASMDEVDPAQIGVLGHCWGGRVAWLAACHLPQLKACALFYGGRVKLPMGGPSGGRYREQQSEDAWQKLLTFLHTTLA